MISSTVWISYYIYLIAYINYMFFAGVSKYGSIVSILSHCILMYVINGFMHRFENLSTIFHRYQ